MTPITRRYLEILPRPRAISVIADTRDPFSVSVPSSQASARPGLRKSMSLDNLNDLNAPKLDRRLRVNHQPVETKVVPVRRAAKPVSKEVSAGPASTKAQEEKKPAPPPKAPTLSRAISMANLRSQEEAAAPVQATTVTEAKGARRVMHATLPSAQPIPRSGASRANVVPPPITEPKQSASSAVITTDVGRFSE